MANVKISNLTAATTPLAGTEVLPVVQSGTTVKASIANVQTATYSGGTANGVAYLNGSKVLTTGSDLVFDGTNLGVGVTPSAWSNAYKSIEIGTVGNSVYGGASSNSEVGMVSAAYYNSGWKYSNTGSKPIRFSMNDVVTGQCEWYTAASGTAGNAITFTQAMTLDASGNLILNDTSRIGSARLSLAVNASTENMLAFKTTTNGEISALRGLNSSGSEVVALNYDTTNSAMLFRTASTERARIDSSGNFLVGTTSNPNSCQIAIGPTASNGISIESNSTSVVMSQLLFRNPNGIVGSVSTAGSLTSFNVSSDYRLKNTIAPMTGALAKVALLKPCTYKWNADGADGEGFIAHELAEVCPNAVTGEKDAVDKDGNIKPQGIDVSFLVATLTAAIQEQQSLITQLTARITALESA